jgi:nucleoside-diphosphate-sugar epimerase
MQVLVTGATGYIGSAVTEALQKSGHDVAGLARSAAAVTRLEERGIRPVPGSLENARLVGEAALGFDGIIHTAFSRDPDAPLKDAALVDAVLKKIAGSGKAFIYTSGVWVLGNTGEHAADEQAPLHPPPLVAWRPAIEQQVLKAGEQNVRGIVIRPAMAYGRRGGIPAMFVGSARETGVSRYLESGQNHWTLVHVDDLADLYVRALESAPAGTLLLGASGSPVTLRELAEGASRAAGLDGHALPWDIEDARGVLGAVADALLLDQRVSGKHAEELLGWRPSAPPILELMKRGEY